MGLKSHGMMRIEPGIADQRKDIDKLACRYARTHLKGRLNHVSYAKIDNYVVTGLRKREVGAI